MDPYTTRALEVMNALDFAQVRAVAESVTTPAGGLSTKTRTVLKGDSGFSHNALTNVVTPATPAAVNGTRNSLRRDPATILATAARRAETLRYVGEDTLEGEKQDVVTFADADGTQVALYVSARTGLVSKFETLADNPVLGDVLTETVLSDYRPVAGAHVAEMAVAYLPKEKLLFVADLFTIPIEGPIAPAGAATRQFADKIQALGLQVEKIAPTHGRIGTIDELKQVVSR